MTTFFQNQWVVSIVAGIISGVIVYFILEWALQQREHSEHLKQINTANLEIIHMLKPYIIEKGLPDIEIIDALIISTARKYNLERIELYSVHILCEELMRDIIENVYVASDKKQEYSVHLKQFLLILDAEKDEELFAKATKIEIESSILFHKKDYQKRLIFIISGMSGALSSAIITLMSLQTGITIELSWVYIKISAVSFLLSLTPLFPIFCVITLCEKLGFLIHKKGEINFKKP